MLPSSTVPPSLLRLLGHFWPCFTRPTFQVFAALVVGAVGRGGLRTVCGMLSGAGLARWWPHDRVHGFFARRRWDVHRVGEVMARLVVGCLTARGEDLVLAVDDTLVKRSGRKVAHRFWQHDGAVAGGRGLAWGVCFVVSALVVGVPGRSGPLALPTLASCWRPAPAARARGGARRRGPIPDARSGDLSAAAASARVVDHARGREAQARRGLQLRLDKEAALPAGHRLPGRDPKPALRARLEQAARERADAEAAHEQALAGVRRAARPATGPGEPDTGARPTKTEIALALAWAHARLFPERLVHVVADAAYHSPALRILPDNLTWTFRLSTNAVLAEAPPPPAQGSPTRPGRPRTAGPRLGTPADIAATATFTPTPEPGRTVAALEVRWPRSLGPTPLRLILIRDTDSDQPYDLALLTTDTTSTPAALAQRYADRWPIETCFQDTRAHLGLHDARNRTPAAVERTVPFQLLCYSLIATWYAHHGDPAADTAARRHHQPWYTTKTEPAFADMLTALREHITEHRITHTTPDQRLRHKIREILHDHLHTAA